MTLRAGVIVFPGSNCDRDMFVCLEEFYDSVNYIWHKEEFAKENYDLIVLPGGFSYGDYLRTGAIASHSIAMNSVREFAKFGGKILGVCNGFQILCESRILSGALVNNSVNRFISKDVYLQASKIDIPICLHVAHNEGNYTNTEYELQKLKNDGNIILRYSNEVNEVSNQTNINGSTMNIAGIRNKNIIGMMPHPERAIFDYHNSQDGRLFFEEYILS